MTRENLRLLTLDVERLLMAGGAVAAVDPALGLRRAALSAAGSRVPALGQLADQTGRVPGASPRDAARALMDLASMLTRVHGALAQPAGVDGTPEDLPPGPVVDSPASAGEVEALYTALTRRGGEGRLAAVRAAGDAAADLRLVDAWRRGLGDPLLGEVIAREVMPRLDAVGLAAIQQDLTLDGDATDARRLLGLAMATGERSRPLVLQALATGSPAVRAAALEALAMTDPAAAVDTAGSTMVHDGHPVCRAAAARVLALGTSEAAAEALVTLLVDAVPAVHQAAATALAAMGFQAVTARLRARLGLAVKAVQAAAGDPSGDTRAEAVLSRVITVLATRGGDGVLAALRALTEHPQRAVWQAACDGVMALGEPQGLTDLAPWMDAEDPVKQRIGIRAVVALGTDAALAGTTRWFEALGTDPRAGTVVAGILAHLVAGATADGLDSRWVDRALAAVDAPEAQGWALECLRRARDPRAVEVLVARLACPDADHPTLLDALGQLGDRRAAGAVLAALGRPEVPPWWVLHALEALDDPSAVGPLETWAAEPGQTEALKAQVASLVATLRRDRTLDGV